MDTLFHFIFSIIIGLALNIKRKHKLRIIVFLAFLCIFIDVDHFFGMTARGTFHNIFFVLALPASLFYLAYNYEKPYHSIKFQTYSLLLGAMLIVHIITDMFIGGKVLLFYPFSMQSVAMTEIWIMATPAFFSPIVSPTGIAIGLILIVIVLVAYLEDIIFNLEKNKEKLKKAIEDSNEDLF